MALLGAAPCRASGGGARGVGATGRRAVHATEGQGSLTHTPCVKTRDGRQFLPGVFNALRASLQGLAAETPRAVKNTAAARGRLQGGGQTARPGGLGAGPKGAREGMPWDGLGTATGRGMTDRRGGWLVQASACLAAPAAGQGRARRRCVGRKGRWTAARGPGEAALAGRCLYVGIAGGWGPRPRWGAKTRQGWNRIAAPQTGPGAGGRQAAYGRVHSASCAPAPGRWRDGGQARLPAGRGPSACTPRKRGGARGQGRKRAP